MNIKMCVVFGLYFLLLYAVVGSEPSEKANCDNFETPDTIHVSSCDNDLLVFKGLQCNVMGHQEYELGLMCLNEWCKGKKIDMPFRKNKICDDRGKMRLPKGKLEIFTAYELQIKWRGCVRKYSLRTNPGQPENLRNAIVICKKEDKLGFRFEQPERPTGISRYRITYSHDDPEVIFLNASGEGSVEICLNNLIPQTFYEISIEASNLGVQAWSEPYKFSVRRNQNGECLCDRISSLESYIVTFHPKNGRGRPLLHKFSESEEPKEVPSISVYCAGTNEIGLKFGSTSPLPDKCSTSGHNNHVIINGHIAEVTSYLCETGSNFRCYSVENLKPDTMYNLTITTDKMDSGGFFSALAHTRKQHSTFFESFTFDYSPENSINFKWRSSFDADCKSKTIKVVDNMRHEEQNIALEDDQNFRINLRSTPKSYVQNVSVFVKNHNGERNVANVQILHIARLNDKPLQNCYLSYFCKQTCTLKIPKQLQNNLEKRAFLLLTRDRSLDDISQDYLDYRKTNYKRNENFEGLNEDNDYLTANTCEININNISIINDNALIYPIGKAEDGLLYVTKTLVSTTKYSNFSQTISMESSSHRPNTGSGVSKTAKITPPFTRITTIILILGVILILSIIAMIIATVVVKLKRRIIRNPVPLEEQITYCDVEEIYYYSYASESMGNLNNMDEANYPDAPRARFPVTKNLLEFDDSISTTSTDSTEDANDFRNFYSDVLEKAAPLQLEKSSQSLDSQIDDYYLTPNLSKMMSMKSLEDDLIKLCKDNLRPLKSEFREVRNLCKTSRVAPFGPCYIKGYANRLAFIALQFPEGDKMEDFWYMIWKERIKYIIAASNPDKNLNLQFYKDWSNVERSFGPISVSKEDVENVMGHAATKFILKFGNRKRVTICYNFIYENKEYKEKLISFMQIFSNIPQLRPSVIMCQEGATIGSLVMCDTAIKMTAHRREVDFMEILFGLGRQNFSFLGSADQYFFAHFIVYDSLFGQRFSVPIDSEFEARIDNVLKIKSVKPLMEAVNNNFYLYENLVNSGRRNTCSGDFNALTVDCFACSRRFVCIPQPSAKNVENFWRLVTESDITTIVSLNELDRTKPTHFKFWSNEMDSSGSKVVQLKVFEERNHGRFTLIRINAIQEENSKEITILNTKRWKRGRYTPSDTLTLLQIWLKIYEDESTHKDKGTVLLTCSNGRTACGLFIAMSILLEAIDLSKTCNVYNAVKLTRRFDSQFVREWGQFDFLHKIAKEYVSTFIESKI